MFQSGCHGREYGNQGNGSEHGPCLRPTMDNSRGALRARTARLQIPGCCTVSVRSQLGRTLLPEYGKFHSRVQPWSGNVRRRPIQKFVCRGTAHWLRFMAVFVCFLAVIGVGMVSDAALMQDRKSPRLHSKSLMRTSYAGLCLKKK